MNAQKTQEVIECLTSLTFGLIVYMLHTLSMSLKKILIFSRELMGGVYKKLFEYI